MADNTTPTPGNPGTYLPIPGQPQNTDASNKDAQNAANIKARNTVPGESAATFNDARQQQGANDGKIYAGPTTPIGDATPKTTEFTDTATIAKGPKGDKGDKGDVGPRGPQGPQGPAGTPDYDLIRQMIAEEIAKQLNFKNLKFKDPVPTSVFATKSISLPVELYDTLTQIGTDVTPTYVLGLSDVGSITAQGLFTAADVTTQKLLTVTANYTGSDGKNYTTSTNITIKVLAPANLAVSGPATLNSAGTGTYVATVTYTDGTSKVVTTDANTTWSIVSGSIGTLNKNVLSAPVVGANVTGQIKASYVEKGVTVSGNYNVTIAAPASKAFYGSAAIPSGDYTAINWSDFIQTLTPGATTRATQFSVNIATNQYGWYAAPVSFGITADSQFLDRDSGLLGGGWGGAMWKNNGAYTGSVPRVVSVMINGSAVQYNLFRTDYMSLGPTNWQIN